MCIPERANSRHATYPETPRVTIRIARPRLLRQDACQIACLLWNLFHASTQYGTPLIQRVVACLMCALLAACESTAPIEALPPAAVVTETVAPTAVAQDDRPEPADLADRLIKASCPSDDRLCAVQTLASLIAAMADPESTAAGSFESVPTTATQAARQALHDRLWRLTGSFPQPRVRAMARGHALAPLWQLRAAMSAGRSGSEQAASFREWAARWPAQPFVALPPTGFAGLAVPSARRGPVGIFLPLSGALAGAGRAARDGYIAAWLDDPAPNKSPLRVYDTAARPLAEIYEESLADGIEHIVGPLSKQRLEALHALRPEVPVLGLNYLDSATCAASTADNATPIGASTGEAHCTPAGGTPASSQNDLSHAGHPPPAAINVLPKPLFLQVGLAIEDEAATIANRLRSEGLHRLLVVRGGEDWAMRGVQTLTGTWPNDIEVYEFADVKTLTESIGGALQIAASTERKDALESLLNARLEFLPRRRADVDGIVAFVDHIEASALAPALKFHFAGDLPVYASSLSIRNATGLDELSGFQVVEMPLNVYANRLWDTVQAVLDKRDGNIAALQALGMDAYRIVAHWGWVARGEPVYGATGELRLGNDGRVRRTLAWASVSRGRIQPANAMR